MKKKFTKCLIQLYALHVYSSILMAISVFNATHPAEEIQKRPTVAFQ